MKSVFMWTSLWHVWCSWRRLRLDGFSTDSTIIGGMGEIRRCSAKVYSISKRGLSTDISAFWYSYPFLIASLFLEYILMIGQHVWDRRIIVILFVWAMDFLPFFHFLKNFLAYICLPLLHRLFLTPKIVPSFNIRHIFDNIIGIFWNLVFIDDLEICELISHFECHPKKFGVLCWCH